MPGRRARMAAGRACSWGQPGERARGGARQLLGVNLHAALGVPAERACGAAAGAETFSRRRALP